MQVYQTITLVLTEQEARDLWLEISEAEHYLGTGRAGLVQLRVIRDQLTARLGAMAALPDPGQQATARVVTAAQGRSPSAAPPG